MKLPLLGAIAAMTFAIATTASGAPDPIVMTQTTQ